MTHCQNQALVNLIHLVTQETFNLTDKRVNELYFGLLNKVIQDKLVSIDLLLQLVISILQGCYSDEPTMLKSVQIGVAN